MNLSLALRFGTLLAFAKRRLCSHLDPFGRRVLPSTCLSLGLRFGRVFGLSSPHKPKFMRSDCLTCLVFCLYILTDKKTFCQGITEYRSRQPENPRFPPLLRQVFNKAGFKFFQVLVFNPEAGGFGMAAVGYQ